MKVSEQLLTSLSIEQYNVSRMCALLSMKEVSLYKADLRHLLMSSLVIVTQLTERLTSAPETCQGGLVSGDTSELGGTVSLAHNIYKELAYDIFANTATDLAQAENIVDWLKHEGILDYDALSEYYEDAE